MKYCLFLFAFLATLCSVSAFSGDCTLYGTMVERKSETCFAFNVEYGVTTMPASAAAGQAPLPFEANGQMEVCSDDSKLQRALNKAISRNRRIRIVGNCVYKPRYLAAERVEEAN